MTTNTDNTPRRKGTRLGVYICTALIVAALCVGVLFYIGWFDNKTHVDTPNGDNVEAQYDIQTSRADEPGTNDWQNPDHSTLREDVVDHAATTDTLPA